MFRGDTWEWYWSTQLSHRNATHIYFLTVAHLWLESCSILNNFGVCPLQFDSIVTTWTLMSTFKRRKKKQKNNSQKFPPCSRNVALITGSVRWMSWRVNLGRHSIMWNRYIYIQQATLTRETYRCHHLENHVKLLCSGLWRLLFKAT